MSFVRGNMSQEQIASFEGSTDFMRVTGLHFEEVSASRVSGWIDIGPQHHQPMGLVHGGVYCAAVEGAASFGASFGAPQGHSVVGVHNSTHFIRPFSNGRVRLEGAPIQQGRTQQLWEVRITSDADGSLLAIGQVRLANLPPRPSP
ncbi:MAG: PaaI family thioesterase [Acidimicrobiales bacterium]